MIEFNATFIVAMLSFVVFIIIMNTIFYNPILGIIRKREEYISSNKENAEQFEKSAQEYEQTHSEKIEETQDICRSKFKTSVGKFQAISGEKIRQAREISKQEIQKQKENLAKQEFELRAAVKNSVVQEMAESIAKKLTNGVINQ